MQHTTTGDGHSAGYEVNLITLLVICHDKQTPSWGAKWRMNDKKKGVGEIRRKNTNKKGRLRADKQVKTEEAVA